MSELIGMSFDQPATPLLSFSHIPGAIDDGRTGWGVAWYPDDELAAAAVRNPGSGVSDGVIDVLADRGTLHASLLIAHLRGAAKRATHRDTHPFVRSFAGRSWTIAHNGDLLGNLNDVLPLPDDPALAPIGSTDTEHLLCWLLGRMAEAGTSTLEEYGWTRVEQLMAQANQLGSLNVLLSDGTSLMAYRCVTGFQPLFCARYVPPETVGLDLVEAGVSVGMGGLGSGNSSLVLLSTLAFGSDTAEALAPGGMAVAAGGQVTVTSLELDGVATPKVTRPPNRTQPRATTRRLEIEHVSRYRYSSPVIRSSHRLRLRPVNDRFQQVFSHDVTLSVPGLRFDFEDVFGNEVAGFELSDTYEELVITARSSVKVMAPVDRPDMLPQTQKLPIVWMPWQQHMLHSYLLPPELPETQLAELTRYARSFAVRNQYELLPTLDDITTAIHNDYKYRPGLTSVETTAYEVYQTRAGVCQDFANLMICLARMLNIPARYRVGYIYTGADYDNTLQSEASHAWVETYLPLMGWRGYDPTNGTRAGGDHVRVAVGRNYRDATPTSGTVYRSAPGKETLDIEVRVTESS
ncbi:MAG: class II glutamine amidotransferase [Acidimicrobiales bacterium]